MLTDFIISTDSGCDLSYEVCKKYNIIPYFMQYTCGEEVYIDKMNDDETREFYKKIIEGKNFKTASININEAYEFLRNLVSYNKPIIHLSLGSGISGTYSNFTNAKNMILEKYPNAVIYIVDTTLASVSYGMLCLEAASMRENGKTYEEVIDYLENNKYHINTYFTTSTLTYLARGGRVTKIASVFGNVLSIKPILRLDTEGHLLVHTKGHGMKNTLQKIIELVSESVIEPEKQTLFISHSDDLERALEYGKALQEIFHFKDVYYTYIGSIIGSHTGPGLVAVFYHGKRRFK